MIVEDVDRRAIAALRFVHGVTGATIVRPLQIESPGLTLVRNLSGLRVVREARGLAEVTTAFDAPPKLTARTPFALEIRDPQGQFLPRRFVLELPRPTRGIDDPPPIADGDRACDPVEIALLPAAASPMAPAWALLRLAVRIQGSLPPRGLANIWVEAQPRVPGKPMRRAQTDADGEALIAIPDVGPIVGGAPLSSTFMLDLSLVLDPELVAATPDDDTQRRTLPLADASTAAARRAASRIEVVTDIEMTAGATRRHVVTLAWP
jgi:hypothetical protein